METLITIWIWFVAMCIYFYPTTYAIINKKNNLAIIMLLNAIWFLIITWIIAFIIAKKSKQKKEFIINENNKFVKLFRLYSDWDYVLKRWKYKNNK